MRARVTASILAIAAASTVAVLAAQQPAPAPATAKPAAGQDTFRAGVEVVNLSVTVVDDKGAVVNGLTKEDFVVLDASKPQEIVSFRTVGRTDEMPVPLGLGLVLDYSTSMCDFKDYQTGCTNSEKLQSLKAALNTIFTKYLKKEDEVYFVEFSSKANLVTKLTTDHKGVQDAIRRQRTHDGTAIYDGMAVGLPEAAKSKIKKQVMLVITDGEDTNSSTNRAKLAQTARDSGVMIYILVVADEEAVRSGQRQASEDAKLRQATEELRAVSNVTGGKTFFLRGFADLEKAIVEVSNDITTQYEIGFARGAEKDGKYHPLQVGVRQKAGDPKMTVRHNPGYVAD